MNQVIKKRIEEINSGRVPEGYKQTPFGIFPCDWETDKTYGDLFEFYGSLSNSREELGEEGYAYLHYGDMHRYSFNKVSYDQYSTLPKIDIALKGKEKFLMQDGDVVFLDASEDLEGTSRCVLIDNPNNEPFFAGLHTIPAHEKGNDFSKWFKQYITLPACVKKQFQRLASGFKVYGLNKDTICQIKYAFPKEKTAQGKIAEILMKWDEMVELQEQYITKLEIRKKTLFSKLFNYKSKYIISMQDVIDKSYMRLIKPKELPYFDDERLYLSTSSIIQNKIVGDEGYITYSNRPSRAQMYPISNSVWFAKMENSIKVFKFNRDQQDRYILSTGYYGLLCDEEKIDSNYLMQNLLSPEFNRIKDLYSEGSSQNGIKDNNLSDILLVLPPMDEQKNIAKILSKADEEISLQKEKLEEIKAQRKILQQYLLTGIVRVVN